MALATVKNKILRNNQTFTQDLNLLANGDKILSYSNSQGDIFSIVKKDGKFKLEFSPLGKGLLNLPDDMNIELDVKSASMLPRKVNGQVTVGQEMELTVNVNGSKGKLVANAETVSFTSGATKYEYNTAEGTGLSVNLSAEGIGMVMGDAGTIFKPIPTEYNKDFPLPVLKLLVAASRNNHVGDNVTIGNFTLRTFPATRTNNYILIDNKTHKGYVLHNSQFVEFNGYVPLQNDSGKCFLALRTTSSAGDLRFDLPTSKGALTPSSLEMIRILQNGTINANNLSDANKATRGISNSSLMFEADDSSNINNIKRDYDGYQYNLGVTPPQKDDELKNIIVTLINKINVLIEGSTNPEDTELLKKILAEFQKQQGLIERLADSVENNGNILLAVQEKISELAGVMTSIQSELGQLREDVSGIREDVNNLVVSTEIFLSALDDKINTLIGSVENGFDRLEAGQDQLRAEMVDMNEEIIKRLELTESGNASRFADILKLINSNHLEAMNGQAELLTTIMNQSLQDLIIATNNATDKLRTLEITNLIGNASTFFSLWSNQESTSLETKNEMNNILSIFNEIQSQLETFLAKGDGFENIPAQIEENLIKLDNQYKVFAETKPNETLDSYTKELIKRYKEKTKETIAENEKERDLTDPPPEQPEEPNDEEKQEEEQEEEKEEKPKEKPEPTEKSYKKHIENWTKALFPIGAFIALAGCLIPGIGPFLVGLGIAVSGTCVVLNENADKFKFKETFGEAEKIISEAEKEELEDALEVAKFLEKEAEVDLAQGKVNTASEKLAAIMLDENHPAHVLSEIYDRCGIGFNLNEEDKDTARSQLLMGTDGHKIRTDMYTSITDIENAPAEEKDKRIEDFIRNTFSKDITPEERNQIKEFFTSEHSAEGVAQLSVVMRDLNAEEDVYLALLTSQRVQLGGMRDTLIERVIASPQLDGKREEFLRRYGSTIYRHFALDDNASQDKLNALFDKLSAEEKEALLSQMEAIGDTMQNQMNGVEVLAGQTREKHERANLTMTYINTMAISRLIPNVKLIYSVSSNVQSYLNLQTYRTNQAQIQGVDATLNEMKALGLEDIVNATTVIPATSGTKTPPMQGHYESIFAEAQKAGIFTLIAEQYVGGFSPVEITTDVLGKDDKALAKITEIVNADPDNPKYATLKKALGKLDIENTINTRTAASFKAFYDKLGITKTEETALNGEIDSEWQKIVEQRKEQKKNKKPFTDAYAGLTDNQVRAVLRCKVYLKNKLENAKTKEEQEKYKNLQKLLSMVLDGSVANYQLAKAENKALGLTILDMDAQIETAANELESGIESNQNLEDILGRLPADDRDEIRKRLARDMPKDGNTNALLRTILSDKYGTTIIETGAPSADQMIDNCITNDLPALLANFPEADREDLKTEIKTALESLKNPLPKAKEEAIRLILNTKYGKDGLIPYGIEKNKVMLPVDAVISQWIDDGVATQINSTLATIDLRARRELSCVASNLGENYSNMLYDDLVQGENLDALEDYGITPEQRAEETTLNNEIISLEETEQRFTSAWNKALGKDFADLQRMLTKPDDLASDHEKQVYSNIIKNLSDMGINVVAIQNILTRLASAAPAEIMTALNTAQVQCKRFEIVSGYSKLGKEFIAVKKKELGTVKKINRALTDHDREYISAADKADTAISKADIFSDKYLAILSLKNPPHSLTEEQIKNILRDFATGSETAYMHLATIPGLKNIRFNANDIAFMRAIGLDDPTRIVTMKKEEVVDAIKKYVDNECKPLEDIQKQGRDERENPNRNDKLETAKKPKQIRNRISLLRRIFGNIKVKDELDRQERERNEQLYAVPELEMVDGAALDPATSELDDSERSA